MSGPVPNRSDDLARPRERKGSGQMSVTKGVLRPVTIPEPSPEWHPIALMLWEALRDSGQSDFYQQSDWAFAFSLCDDLSYYKSGIKVFNRNGEEYTKPRSGQMLQTIYTAMSNLLVSEADRRRVRIELTEPEDESHVPAELVVMDDYRRDLGVADD